MLQKEISIDFLSHIYEIHASGKDSTCLLKSECRYMGLGSWKIKLPGEKVKGNTITKFVKDEVVTKNSSFIKIFKEGQIVKAK
jgi:hypothetical protein